MLPSRTPPPARDGQGTRTQTAVEAASRARRSDTPGSGRVVKLAGAGVVALIAIVLLVTQVFSSGGTSKPSAPAQVAPSGSLASSSSKSGSSSAATGAAAARRVRVAVLNGTAVAGLARNVAGQLSRGGYPIGIVTNAPTQQQTTTTVYYASGARSQATAVAQTIGAGPNAVQQLDPATQTIAHGATVVVTVGSDRQGK
jgi:LytR cell envelope-related transcriptional attenuator